MSTVEDVEPDWCVVAAVPTDVEESLGGLLSDFERAGSRFQDAYPTRDWDILQQRTNEYHACKRCIDLRADTLGGSEQPRALLITSIPESLPTTVRQHLLREMAQAMARYQEAGVSVTGCHESWLWADHPRVRA